MTLDDLLCDYLATSARITSGETGRRYRTLLNGMAKHLGRRPTIEDLTPDTYGRWVNARRRVVAPNTVVSDCEKLCVLWTYAARKGLCDAPEVHVPHKVHRAPSAYTDDEMRRIWRAATKCDWTIGQVPGAVYWPALVSVLYQTAERIAPVHALRGDDIDLEARKILFRAETRKGQRADSVRPIDKECARHVGALLEFAPGKPFAVVRFKTLYPAYRRLLCEARVSPNRHKMFHAWRRRHASDLTREGLDATVSLGHSSRSVTTRSYIDPGVALSYAPLGKLRRMRRGWRYWLARLFKAA